MAEDIKTINLTATDEDPQVVLEKSWIGYVVVSTEARMATVAIREPDTICIPMMEPLGPLTRAQEVAALRAAYQGASDVYVIHYETPSGINKQGLIAVPKATKPDVRLA